MPPISETFVSNVVKSAFGVLYAFTVWPSNITSVMPLSAARLTSVSTSSMSRYFSGPRRYGTMQ